MDGERIDDIVRLIQLILGPAVMITSCCILLTGLLPRYATIAQRARAMNGERLDLLHEAAEARETIGGPAIAFHAERLSEITAQLPDHISRYALVRNSIVAILSAIGIFLVSMFVIAVAALTESDVISVAALVAFLLANAVFLIGIFTAILEVFRSSRSLGWETARLANLEGPHPGPDDPELASTAPQPSPAAGLGSDQER